MFKRTGTKILTGVLCSIFLLPVLLYALSFVKDRSYGTVNNNKDRLSESKTSVSLKGGTDSSFNEVIDYSDTWFEKKSQEYNHELAKSSLLLSLSTFSSGNILENWGETGEYGRENNLKEAFNGLNFFNEKFSGYDSSLNNTESKAAFGMAMKKFYTDNVACNIVLIAIRSGGYGCEWTDNFNVGDDSIKYHKGFYDSALKIKEYAHNYVSQYCKNEKVKYWICGYSRGGAIANILASLIDTPENVYAYTFATPNTIEHNNNDSSENNNIFNIINPYDPVVTLPPNEWGFGKIGVTMKFPAYDEEDSDKDLFNKVSDNYYKLTGKKADLFSYGPISDLMNIITSFVKNRNDYKNDFQNVFKDLATATMTKIKIQGFWKKINFIEFMEDKFSDKVSIAISESENCQQYQALKSLGIKIPQSMKELDIALRLYNYDSPEKLLLESLTLDSVHGINSLTDSNAFADFAIGHYPEVYISWMKTINKNNFTVVNHK